ncbi:hypothetical protein [Saccharothrix sp. NRRL B-16314]|uniref:hypothetical protein n=1 Tax=Saccharothrix sp. NRRL B-16314 TaxID=1463825 RepID=UPI00069030DC|nr:hypothetical protein [Saccharothrix sp. NRRL B-16314]
MTDHRQHLTTEDFAGRTPAERESLVPRQSEREPVEQTPADRDVLEPDLTDQERFDREPTAHDETATHQDHAARQGEAAHQNRAGHYDLAAHQNQAGHQDEAGHQDQVGQQDQAARQDQAGYEEQAAPQDRVEHQEHDQHDAGYDSQSVEDEGPVAREQLVELSAVSTTAGDAPLFTTDDAADYQAEWRALQADFVDDPREAVQRADELVAQVMQTLATTFNEHKQALEEQWQRGDEAQTEELRQALKRYRSFFDRLLSV